MVRVADNFEERDAQRAETAQEVETKSATDVRMLPSEEVLDEAASMADGEIYDMVHDMK